MKRAKKSDTYEPTLSDVLGAVQTGFEKIENKFEERFDGLEYRMTAIEKRTGALEDAVEDMKETLDGVARAVDKDSVKILDHERRIRRLEKANV
ncbi:hypothetical protein HYV30_02140 [Candidatus Kaiserbacteria bacterium]|nr:hypothetical protein [Candidatus Kaiserbacteria bacterium]